jgi:hypothetical protein
VLRGFCVEMEMEGRRLSLEPRWMIISELTAVLPSLVEGRRLRPEV